MSASTCTDSDTLHGIALQQTDKSPRQECLGFILKCISTPRIHIGGAITHPQVNTSFFDKL
jgi:hypothetical protein